MKKNFSNEKTPITSQDWRQKSEEHRIEITSNELKKK